jgi:hypothetical protein
MPNSFPLLDLVSQAVVVQRLLRGRSDGEKLAWLAAHGRLTLLAGINGARDIHVFESTPGLSCCFFVDRDEFAFIVDHTTFRVRGGGPPRPGRTP